jgi:hypothetical protein
VKEKKHQNYSKNKEKYNESRRKKRLLAKEKKQDNPNLTKGEAK